MDKPITVEVRRVRRSLDNWTIENAIASQEEMLLSLNTAMETRAKYKSKTIVEAMLVGFLTVGCSAIVNNESSFLAYATTGAVGALGYTAISALWNDTSFSKYLAARKDCKDLHSRLNKNLLDAVNGVLYKGPEHHNLTALE